MEKKIIDLEIVDELEGSGVDAIALVDAPAIEKNFMYFKQEKFVEPQSGESQEDYMGRCVPVLIDEGKDQDQAVAICISTYENMGKQEFETECPPATQDIALNLENRQNAIDIAHYGPLNPNEPSEAYWEAKAEMFNTTIDEAKSALCGNCAFFKTDQTTLDCIASGIGSEDGDPYDVIDAGVLGYCEAFDFKCAAARTCDAWVAIKEKMEIDTSALPTYIDQIGKKKKKEQFAESYTDYPKEAVENARRALAYAEENGWGDCGMATGKARANQLANEEPISEDTIARMASFERHRQNSDTPYGEGCGKLMWDAWGGDAGIEWAQRKLEQIRKEEFAERPISRIPEEERGREGSDKNKEGDTKTSRGGIEVSEEVESTLKDKIKEHNEKNPQDSQKADLGMLKAVWRRGAGAYSVGTPGRRGMTRAQWAMGRVNAFLKILSGSSPSDKDYSQDNDLLPKGHPKHSEQKMSADVPNLDAVLEFAKTAGFSPEDFTLNGLQFNEETEEMDLKFAKGYTVYKYTGSVGSDTRDFCREMVNMDRFYTFEEIDAMGDMAVNPGFGLNGDSTYSIWKYKGGPNCKHRWTKFYINEAGNPENKGAAPGIAGEKPNDMPNNGYAFAAIEDKRELVGPVAVPDIEIPRKDKEGNLYFVRFSPEVVRKMAEKFMREQRLSENNIQHNGDDDAGTYVFESWIVETPEDKANTVYNLDVPVGTWCVKMRVVNPQTWAKVKAGEVKGFSLEGSFMDRKDWEQYQKDREIYNKVIKILKSC